MEEDDAFDPTQLSVLVIDQNHFQRGIALDQLRGMGFRRATGAPDAVSGWDALCKINPDIVLIEGAHLADGGLEFVRKVRAGGDAPNRAVAIFMLTTLGAQDDVEAARKAGVNGYLRKPISALAMQKRVRAVVLRPQPFIETANYVGPCRRRRQDANYQGPWRRLDDDPLKPMRDAEQEDLHIQLARACVAALDVCARDFTPGDTDIARKVFQSAKELCDVAERINDSVLLMGAKEMVRYLQAQGATARLDPEAVRTHIAALHQLVHLPHALTAEREQVVRGLKRMVDKKLRPAA